MHKGKSCYKELKNMKESRKEKKKRPLKIGDIGFHIVNYIFFGLFVIVAVYPLYFVIINAISDPQLVKTGSILFYPRRITFRIFRDVFALNGLGKAALTSVLRTVLATLATVLSTSVVGYVMTKQELKHKTFWYRYFIITMYVSAGMIPGYLNLYSLGFLNSFWFIYVIPCLSSPYNMILVKTYIENLPSSLEEAAYIDGAGYFKRFVYIIIPLSKPILATIAIFSAVGAWNTYMDTLLYMTKGGYQTLQSVLYTYINQSSVLASLMRQGGSSMASSVATALSPRSIKYAVTTITILPILIVYPFFQRYFTKGIMIGAVKG